MQIRFNTWPGDASFGGNFDPAILPIHQYVNWVQYSSYVDGAFQLEWREDFSGATIPSGWQTGTWGSPKNLSTHASANVNIVDGYAVLSLTADDAMGPAGAAPLDPEDPGPPPAPSVSAAPSTAAPMPPATADGNASSNDMGAAEGCTVRTRPAGERADWRWLLLALGLALGHARRRSNPPCAAFSLAASALAACASADAGGTTAAVSASAPASGPSTVGGTPSALPSGGAGGDVVSRDA
jgi:hypothetical protein